MTESANILIELKELYDSITEDEMSIINEIAQRKHVPEPLLESNDQYYASTEISHKEIYELYERHKANFWTEKEIPMFNDKQQWDTILYPGNTVFERTQNKLAQQVVKLVLSFFANADKLVAENLTSNFINQIRNKESGMFFTFQAAMEHIHNLSYEIQLNTLVPDPKERDELVNGIYKIEAVRNKAKWALKYLANNDPNHYISRPESIGLRLFAFALVENIHFAGSFAIIYWLKELGVLPGLCRYNEQISADEMLHFQGGCVHYKYIKNKLSTHHAHAIVKEAVNIEIKFFEAALPEQMGQDDAKLVALKRSDMNEYIKFVANGSLSDLGYPKLYPKVTNPFGFMKKLGVPVKNNPHEQTSTEYNMPGTFGDQEEQEYQPLSHNF
jgi:ribonucleoside-diphosphate reductase beta chain